MATATTADIVEYVKRELNLDATFTVMETVARSANLLACRAMGV